MKKKLILALWVILSVTSLTNLVGYLGDHHWLLDLFSHFKLQYALILFAGIVLMISLKVKRGFSFVPFLIWSMIDIVPLYFPASNPESTPRPTDSVKIVCINLLSSNGEYDAVRQFVKEESPDVLILLEMTELWRSALDSTLSNYPDQKIIIRSDNFGIAAYSKMPVAYNEAVYLGPAEVPSVALELGLDNRQINILGTHPPPPVGTEDFDFRNSQFEALARHAKTLNGEIILIGDLNSSSYSNHFKRLVYNSGLIDSRKGFGILSSWPTWSVPMYTTLDHCLVSEGLLVKSRRVGRHVGSDHLPIIVEIAFR